MVKIRTLQSDKDIAEAYPNEALVTGKTQHQVHESNYFINHDEDVIKKKFVQWLTLMEFLNAIMELPVNATFNDLANRGLHLSERNNAIYKNETEGL